MNTIKMMLAIFSMAAVATSANAAERIVLNYGGTQYQGSSTLFLKQKLKQQYPRLNIEALNLQGVRLVAKSKFGHGQAALRVGNRTTGAQRIYGTPAEFHRHHPRTWDRLDFENPRRNDLGVWQIQMNGNIKVQRVVLFVEIDRPGRGGGGRGRY